MLAETYLSKPSSDTTYTYDLAGEVMTKTYPSSRTVRITRDAAVRGAQALGKLNKIRKFDHPTFINRVVAYDARMQLLQGFSQRLL